MGLGKKVCVYIYRERERGVGMSEFEGAEKEDEENS